MDEKFQETQIKLSLFTEQEITETPTKKSISAFFFFFTMWAVYTIKTFNPKSFLGL